ncbi:hypothetical protein I350_06154 [Cryptococcus amylolentus CBS 6273]|uniref:Uncharacterized protein n=1 Tax=Cryptococcus amylolentus CBS 6273 TaxID=1296118 RepID=A0A1E3JR16_9TREE|nr:hypothetical protein I350_06154 [Cryptococcus amylolentus CBS 6273]
MADIILPPSKAQQPLVFLPFSGAPTYPSAAAVIPSPFATPCPSGSQLPLSNFGVDALAMRLNDATEKATLAAPQRSSSQTTAATSHPTCSIASTSYPGAADATGEGVLDMLLDPLASQGDAQTPLRNIIEGEGLSPPWEWADEDVVSCPIAAKLRRLCVC